MAGQLKLIDFGIANAIQQDMTSVTRDQQVGTLNFMSPEAILDTCAGSQVDENGRVKPRIKVRAKSALLLFFVSVLRTHSSNGVLYFGMCIMRAT